jgi:ATP-dependent exoDNAse (exonuclease V) beta subunit
MSAPGPEIEVLELARAADRPFGPRYGTLVHAVLATAPLDAGADGVRALAATHGRILRADAGEVASAADVVSATLAHPYLTRARAALDEGRCRRELPIVRREVDGTLVEGAIDLVIEEDDRLIVLDFKTDREVAADLDRYRRQVGLYCRALAEATGQTVKGGLLRV